MANVSVFSVSRQVNLSSIPTLLHAGLAGPFEVSSLSMVLLALLVASFSFASFRFDQMQRVAREFSLSSEAFYSKARTLLQCI